KAGDRLILYVTAHGGKSSQKDNKHNTKIWMWNRQSIDAAKLAGLLDDMGVDVLITHPFDRSVAALSASQFLARLKARLGFRRLWIGYDFAMGKNREGNVEVLGRLGGEMDYQLHVVQAVELAGGVVSSSRIRALISEGGVADASELLGRPYSLAGEVVKGEGRGRTIGIPTANLSVPADRALPGNGVYVCRAHFEDRSLGAATNVGVRPTFDGRGSQVTVEAHLLDFEGDIYGEILTLEFIQRIRGERQFPNPQALVEQIRADIVTAREVLVSGTPV
ncbi:MAG: riboflavin biosynthesis protein RibF, partial [Anaerolineales bacterium]|nr:riboflavin biosynthesis protein RibF [Anaerolineales bacterium]